MQVEEMKSPGQGCVHNGLSMQKRESSKVDRKKKEAEEEASGILNEAGRKLRGSGRWIGDRAETVKDKAG